MVANTHSCAPNKIDSSHFFCAVWYCPELVFLTFKRSSEIDSKGSVPPAYVASTEILEQSMGAENRVGIGLSYRAARQHRLAESIPWNRFLGSLKVEKFRLSVTAYSISVMEYRYPYGSWLYADCCIISVFQARRKVLASWSSMITTQSTKLFSQ